MELKVVVAALVERDARILVGQRPAGKHLAGYWEFPGGKRETGESPQAALHREMAEELGMDVRVGELFTAVYHAYETFELLMLVYHCDPGPVEPAPIGCAAVRWVDRAELRQLRVPPADGPIVDRLLARV